MEDFVRMLEARGIKPTAIRLLVLRSMAERGQASSLADMEERLDTVDKSTISRAISLFHKKLLVHSIDDGSGSIKYSVCRSDCNCLLEDLHVHFCCLGCKKTFCLESLPVPSVQLPGGFMLESVNFVLKGRCPVCSRSVLADSPD
ncbi:MAG: transcriptional repressor [Tannerellaceae bacterium]|jgi:Fur family ferric uptake transcriptional regulator|nr:transcriptional repressor [Tannerellaceae bacterium]